MVIVADATSEETKKNRQQYVDLKQKQQLEEEAKAISKHRNLEHNRYRKAIRDAINDTREPKSIRNLRYSSVFIFLVLVAIAVAEFIETIRLYSQID